MLQDVNFFSEKYQLLETSFEQLNDLAFFMKEYPKMSIEITGHTDEEEYEKANKILSKKRATAVVKYLIKQGVNPKRLHAVGKGSKRPLVKEMSPLNNRIEFTVVSNPIVRKDRGFAKTLREELPDTSRQIRMALVIGNASYQHSPDLKNPLNDARLMSGTLTDLGFEVTTLLNLDYQAMIGALKSFSAKVRNADVIMFYFAGHGLQVSETNYLLPIDAKLENGETDVAFEAINLELVLKILEYTNGKSLNMIILDACRNNPFASWKRGGEGLAEVKVPSGSLIAYATSPGSIASDGTGENGLYTSILAEELKQSQRLEDIFINTRNKVEELSNGNQSPWELAKLRGRFYLK